ncbi:Uma2 family endonuclease [Planktothrix mougeotii]|uniref:Uma2 family endonuclease n=1 Tax=Planktothrix mougeotii LEGE 06226 TaxID=1828728 RepID=A0ABR9ULH7_9CYAN|nr:Uma2 family endonuclease [Planktothrix mougeotii]MBE9146656.1 Uma2 family endonuclease [Planktothrix mougeotii LEGE 06226]
MEFATINLSTPLQLTIDLTDEQFFELCQNNRDLKFERTASGVLTIMSPTGGNTGRRSIKIATQLEIWSSKLLRSLI